MSYGSTGYGNGGTGSRGVMNRRDPLFGGPPGTGRATQQMYANEADFDIEAEIGGLRTQVGRILEMMRKN